MSRPFLTFGLPVLVAGLTLAGCSATQTPVRRLNPVGDLSGAAPKTCKLVSIMADSPAARAGLKEGAEIRSVNGVVPADALAVSDLVGQSPSEMRLELTGADGALTPVTVHLNATKPRLGAVCDLTGLRKKGLTPAGNESLTVYQGPFSLGASAIIDKQTVFARVRLTNNSDKTITIGPELFTAKDGKGQPLAILSPQQVMCDFYGAKGARMLALKRQKVQSLETQPTGHGNPEETCPMSSGSGRLSAGANASFLEANAEYLAGESLWPASYATGQTADGLIYMPEPSILPVTITAHLEGRTIDVSLGQAQASQTVMATGDLEQFFENQKRGTPLSLTLRKGKVFVGRFASYDSDNEKVWFDAPSGGLLSSVSFPLRDIQSAETLEQLPAKSGSR